MKPHGWLLALTLVLMAADVVSIQVAITNVIMMMLPVPFIFVVALTFAFSLDTVLDNEANNLSVGQRQLLTIARVFLADPAMLIFDEATSSVDTRTEQAIAKAMNMLMANRTSFVIAHRLSTIRDADLILYMEHGDILEHGTPRSCLRKTGHMRICTIRSSRDARVARNVGRANVTIY